MVNDEKMANAEVSVKISVDTTEIDLAIEKVGRLFALLREAQEKAGSLGNLPHDCWG